VGFAERERLAGWIGLCEVCSILLSAAKAVAFPLRGGIVKSPQFLRAVRAPMEREYELFEQLSDGSPMWRGHASGLHEVQRQLRELTKTTKNECFAMYLQTKEIVARVNVHTTEGRKPFVFQITYDEKLATARSEVLKLHGYEVATVFGSGAARLVLHSHQHCDLFVLGHAAPEEERREMVEWLKKNYPGVPILALNSPGILRLSGADYNLKLNGPETLLPVIASALTTCRGGASVAG
jgi:hypothetical protein